MKMQFPNFQTIANVGVVLGLLALIFQLYQDHQLKRAELIWHNLESHISQQLVLLGENPMPVLVKAAQDPEGLSAAEAAIVIAYGDLTLADVTRNHLMENQGLFTPAWRQDHLIDHELGSPVGNSYLSSRIENMPISGGLKKKIRDELATVRANDSFLKLLQEYSGKRVEEIK